MSGGLNVIARTQKIIVEPASASVAVTNVGMPGPAGPRGLPGPPGPGGPGTTPEWAQLKVIGGIFGTTTAVFGLNKMAGSSGITVVSSTKLTVPKNGMYFIVACITVQGTGGVGWVTLGCDHRRANGTLVGSLPVVGQVSAQGAFDVITICPLFNMLATDYVEFNICSSAVSQTLDDRGWVAITELPSNIGPAIVPPGGNTGQVLAKLSTNDYDVGWVDPI